MAKLWATSFPHSNLAKIFDAGNDGTVSTLYGRNGRRGMGILPGGGGDRRKNLGASYSTLIVHAAIQVVSCNIVGMTLLDFRDAGTSQCKLTMGPDGILHFTGTSNTGSIGAFGVSHVSVEVKVTIHNTAGAVEVRVNGTNVLSATGINTRVGTANNSANEIRLHQDGQGSPRQIYWADLLFMDTSGSTMNDFLGDIRVIEDLPTGDEGTNNGTPTTGTDHYAMVDEYPPDDDTSYLDAGTVGDVELFTFPNLPVTTGPVYCNDVLFYARKTDAGGRSLAGHVKHSSSTADGATVALGTGFAYGEGHFVTNPSTSAAWTIAEVNAAAVGYKVIA